MMVLLDLTKSILGELGGLRYLVLISLVIGISVPALFVESTVSGFQGLLPTNYLSHPDTTVGFVELGGVKEIVLLVCYKNISLLKESEKTSIKQVFNTSQGIIVPLAYMDKALNSSSLRVYMNGSWRDYWLIGYYSSPTMRFVIIDTACGAGAAYDSSRVIYSEILGNARSLTGLIYGYVVLSVLLITALSAWRARGGLQRIAWAFLTQGVGSRRLSALLVGASFVTACVLALTGVSMGLVMSDIVAYSLARVVGVAAVSTVLDMLDLVYVSIGVILAVALPVSAIVVSTILAWSKGD